MRRACWCPIHGDAFQRGERIFAHGHQRQLRQLLDRQRSVQHVQAFAVTGTWDCTSTVCSAAARVAAVALSARFEVQGVWLLHAEEQAFEVAGLGQGEDGGVVGCGAAGFE